MENVILHNNPRSWDGLWAKEAEEPWRADALRPMYERIAGVLKQHVEPGLVVDIGGGNGALADILRESGYGTLVVDHSYEALKQAEAKGHATLRYDLEDEQLSKLDEVMCQADAVVCTEVIEHLTDSVMHKLLAYLAVHRIPVFISTPNNKWGPDEEPQHARKLTVLQFLKLMRTHFPNSTRVECFEPWYQLAVCGIPKKFTMSVCFPARNEAEDIERVLKSFRPIADEIVVGIDPRTTDETREIAERYAEKIFELEDPQGAVFDDTEINEAKSVHFSHIRNQCLDYCTGDWIFMTEAHEHLASGIDTLLRMDTLVPDYAQMCAVLRTSFDDQWGFPWLMRSSSKIRYTRRTHNKPDYPANTVILQMPQVKTYHQRHMKNAVERAKQRKVTNRKTLLEDWVIKQDEASLYYLGSEMRMYNPQKAIDRLEQLLSMPPKNGPMRYQARLNLAHAYTRLDKIEEARRILLRCVEDDWCRSDHWIWLGDIAHHYERYPEALQFYTYAASMIGSPPFTMWWIRLSFYTYIPAQRLAMCYSALGDGKKALYWARRVLDLLPDDAPEELMKECKDNEQYLADIVEGKKPTEEEENGNQ